jgi:hypothetical protein
LQRFVKELAHATTSCGFEKQELVIWLLVDKLIDLCMCVCLNRFVCLFIYSCKNGQSERFKENTALRRALEKEWGFTGACSHQKKIHTQRQRKRKGMYQCLVWFGAARQESVIE